MESLISGFQGLLLGVTNLGVGHVIMILIGSLLLYLGISKGYEPLLLVPIGFGAILVNIPLAEMMGDDGYKQQGFVPFAYPQVEEQRSDEDHDHMTHTEI